MNAVDIILIIIIAAAVVGALVYILRRRGNGCGGCEGCAYSDSCKKKNN